MNNGRRGFGVGVSSIVLIAAVLCLTVFAVLSLVSARNDIALSERTAESAATYYAADRKAQFIIAEVDALAGDDDFTIDGVEKDGGTVRFQVIVDENRVLNVVLDTSGGSAEIIDYRLLTVDKGEN